MSYSHRERRETRKGRKRERDSIEILHCLHAHPPSPPTWGNTFPVNASFWGTITFIITIMISHQKIKCICLWGEKTPNTHYLSRISVLGFVWTFKCWLRNNQKLLKTGPALQQSVAQCNYKDLSFCAASVDESSLALLCVYVACAFCNVSVGGCVRLINVIWWWWNKAASF